MGNTELINRVLELERMVRNLRNEWNSFRRSSSPQVAAILNPHRKADVDFTMFPRRVKNG